MMNSLANPEFRSLSAEDIDQVSGGGFWAVVGAAASPVAIGAGVVYLLARDSGQHKAQRDNELGVCQVPNT